MLRCFDYPHAMLSAGLWPGGRMKGEADLGTLNPGNVKLEQKLHRKLYIPGTI
jgi:hypothetical protein